VICEKVLDREDPDCSCSFRHKCWQLHLKGSKIGSLVGIEDERNLNSKSLLDTLPNLGKNHEIQLRLDWEHRLH
jgi:hypothetical protein